MDDIELKWLVLLLLSAALAGAVWYFWDDINPPSTEPAAAPPEAAEVAREPREPLHPVEPLRLETGDGELIELPPLEESDRYFALALIEVFGRNLDALLSDEQLIDKSVATVDNLTRDRIAEKIRPVGRVPGAFAADSDGANGPYYLGAENFARYDALVDMLAGADLDELAETYRRFYPLMQQAYVGLGYPEGYFNDRVIEVIDHLLATPEPEGPVQLVRPHVLFEFADPDLEDLSSGQKLLLRMGNDHAARVKGFLEELKSRISRPLD